jgi:hypothetical protein
VNNINSENLISLSKKLLLLPDKYILFYNSDDTADINTDKIFKYNDLLKITYNEGTLSFEPIFEDYHRKLKIVFKFNKTYYRFKSNSIGGKINIYEPCDKFSIYFQYTDDGADTDTDNDKVYMNLYKADILMPDSVVDVD